MQGRMVKQKPFTFHLKVAKERAKRSGPPNSHGLRMAPPEFCYRGRR